MTLTLNGVEYPVLRIQGLARLEGSYPVRKGREKMAWSTNDDEISKVSIRATRDDPFYEAVRIAVFAYRKDSLGNYQRVVLERGEFTRISDGAYPLLCGHYIGFEEAQVLMDDLWKAGLRPIEGAGAAGAMAAVQEHLKDLQKENDWLRTTIDELIAPDRESD